MKTIIFKNRINGERVLCDNTREVRVIDGVEYFLVRRTDHNRQFLMRKDALVKETKK
jgi:hypothetical protein